MVPNGWEVVPIWHPLGFKQKSSVWMGFGPPTPVQCQVGQMMIQSSRILFKLGGKRTANYWKLSSSLARRTTKQHVIRQCRPREHRRNMFCWEICEVSVVFENQNCLPESLNQSRYHFWDLLRYQQVEHQSLSGWCCHFVESMAGEGSMTLYCYTKKHQEAIKYLKDLSSDQNPGYLMYIGDYTNQFYGDYNMLL